MKKIIFGSIILTLSLFALVNIAGAKVDRVPGPVEYGPWDVNGVWVFDYHYMEGTNLHDMNLVQAEDGTLEGSGGAFSAIEPYQYPWTVTNGLVDGSDFNMTADYDLLSCSFTLVGEIDVDGKISGTWTDNCFGARGGTWTTTVGTATRESTQFTGNHGQYVSSQEDKQEAAQSHIGMPIQSKGHEK